MVLVVGQVGRDHADSRIGPLGLGSELRAAEGILGLEDQPGPRITDLAKGRDRLGGRLAIGEIATGI